MVSVRKLGKYIYVIIKKMNPLKTLTTLLKIKGKGGLILSKSDLQYDPLGQSVLAQQVPLPTGGP